MQITHASLSPAIYSRAIYFSAKKPAPKLTPPPRERDDEKARAEFHKSFEAILAAANKKHKRPPLWPLLLMMMSGITATGILVEDMQQRQMQSGAISAPALINTPAPADVLQVNAPPIVSQREVYTGYDWYGMKTKNGVDIQVQVAAQWGQEKSSNWEFNYVHVIQQNLKSYLSEVTATYTDAQLKANPDLIHQALNEGTAEKPGMARFLAEEFGFTASFLPIKVSIDSK